MLRVRNMLWLLVVVPSAAAVLQAPNLSGTWVLQVDKSDFGQLPGPTSRTDVIAYKEPKLTIKRTTVSPQQGTLSADFVYAVDGKQWKNKLANGTDVSTTLKWEGQVLVMTTVQNTPQGEATITDRLSLSADGKTLTHDRLVMVQALEIVQKMILAKQ